MSVERLYSSFGKTTEENMYSGGVIFVEHASGYKHVEMLVGFTAAETIAAKHRFERHMHDMGIKITSYRTDNGVFAAEDFVTEVEKSMQSIKYSGVGAHHQNGVAERGIGTLMSMARTMMLHAAIRWPDMADSSLWPMAVDYAAYIYNHVPDASSGLAPIELATRCSQRYEDLSNVHVWGSPVYVLDPKLQDSKGLPKWTKRSRCGVYLGQDDNHHTAFGKILNATVSLCLQRALHHVLQQET